MPERGVRFVFFRAMAIALWWVSVNFAVEASLRWQGLGRYTDGSGTMVMLGVGTALGAMCFWVGAEDL